MNTCVRIGMCVCLLDQVDGWMKASGYLFACSLDQVGEWMGGRKHLCMNVPVRVHTVSLSNRAWRRIYEEGASLEKYTPKTST